jgi:ABC-type Na+ efflux pump permease subunit
MSAGWNNRRFIAMLRKETLQILRDPSTIVIAFVLPIVLIFLFGYGINLDTARTRIAVSLQDGSQAGQSLAGAFQRSRFFDVAATGDLAALKRDLVSGRVRGIVVIPEEFGRTAARGGRYNSGHHRRVIAEHVKLCCRLCRRGTRHLGGGTRRRCGHEGGTDYCDRPALLV